MLTKPMKTALLRDFNSYDFLGIFLSILCGIHCIVTPLAILYLPSLGKSLESTWIHFFLIVFVALSFHQSIYSHFKLHRSRLTLGLGLLGFIILLISYFFEIFSHNHKPDHAATQNGELLVLVLAFSGALLLITSHILNIQKCKCLKGKGTCSSNHTPRKLKLSS